MKLSSINKLLSLASVAASDRARLWADAVCINQDNIEE